MATIRISLLFAGFLLISAFCCQENALQIEKMILNKWVNKDGSKIIEFITHDSKFDAIIRKAKNPKLVGQKQISGLQCFSSECRNGTFHLIKRNLEFPCNVMIKSATEIVISVRSGSNIQSLTWTKLNP